MCGIAGIISNLTPDLPNLMTGMLLKMARRGPDDQGIWHHNEICLGHTRLAIKDLTVAGHQPIVSSSGRYVLVYNGEIYNDSEVLAHLPPHTKLSGYSDTAILIEAIDYLGISQTVKLLNGMFAFAVYDRKSKNMSLVRDRIGIKPLYYAMCGNQLVFASQISALLSVPFFSNRVSQQALGLYLKYNFIPAPYAIFENCYKQLPGTILTFCNGSLSHEETYWSLKDAYRVQSEQLLNSEQECLDYFEAALFQAVKQQLIADVPIGIFLSSGIDSSLLTALAVQTGKKISTFSIGFYENQYNEAVNAKKIAQHLGVEHHEEYISVNQALETIPLIPKYCDEPLGDASQVPTLLLSQLTRKHVTVALSGDGGDELFYGYSRYRDLINLRIIQQLVPRKLCRLLFAIISKSQLARDSLSFKLQVAHGALNYSDILEQYDSLFNFWPNTTYQRLPDIAPPKPSKMLEAEYMGYHDLHCYLPDDLLVKTDRCSMYHSLEARLPFLNHPVIEAALRVPMRFKMGGGSKYLLKKVLEKYLPSNLITHKKKGFALPIDNWLRGPLKDWMIALLDEAKKDEMIPSSLIEHRIKEHLSKKSNWQYSLWNLCMWQLWRNEFSESRSN